MGNESVQIDKQRSMDNKLEVLDGIVGRMSTITSRIRAISSRLHGAEPEGDSKNEVVSVPDGSIPRFGYLNDAVLTHIVTAEDLLTRIEEGI